MFFLNLINLSILFTISSYDMARLKVEASTIAGPGMRQVYETALGKQILNHYRANKDLFGEIKVLRDEECVGAMRPPSRDGCCSVMRREFISNVCHIVAESLDSIINS